MHNTIDYSSPRVIRSRARQQIQRRGTADHEYIIGGLRMHRGSVVVAAVYAGPAYDVIEALTTDPRRWARWRTKQAAWQWLNIRCRPDWRVIHLGRLDVLAMSQAETAALPTSQ